MLVKVKKLNPDAVLPSSSNETDAGFDLVATDDGEIKGTYIQYKTGISIEPEIGYHTEIFPRSSISKTDLVLANSIGLVDEGYRGEILVRFKIVPRQDDKPFPVIFKKGDRIAQLVVRKTERAIFEWRDELSDTTRGESGFGSSGK